MVFKQYSLRLTLLNLAEEAESCPLDHLPSVVRGPVPWSTTVDDLQAGQVVSVLG